MKGGKGKFLLRRASWKGFEFDPPGVEPVNSIGSASAMGDKRGWVSMPPGSRGYDGMKGLGFGFGREEGEMEEGEREEGEACLGEGEDDGIDPDVDLSYIDVKLQHVLGHLQREFEGGMSVDNLGAKFGGYGSFLPAYKRSPSALSQPGSPPKEPGCTVVRFPHGLSCEDAGNYSLNVVNEPIAKNSLTLTKDLDLGGSARKDASTTSTTGRNHKEDNDLLNKGTKGSIQNTLKVRIKVGPDNISARNNAAIYSGLGLELSPSSSLDNSPEGKKGTLEDDVAAVSPRDILQMMTGFPNSEGCFLSPLQENLIRLAEAGDHFGGNHREDLLGKSIREAIPLSVQLNSPTRSNESCRETAMKLPPESIQIGWNKSNKNDKILEKKASVETPQGQDLNLQTSTIPPLLNSGTYESKIMVRKIVSKHQEDSVKGTKKTFDQQAESSRMLNDNTFHSGPANSNSFDSKRSMESDGIVSLNEKAVYIKANPSPRINLTRGGSVEKNLICGENVLSCLQKECMDKSENGINLTEVEFDEAKAYKDQILGTNEFTKLNNSQKAVKFSETKGKSKEHAANATSVTDPPEKTMASLSLLSGKEEKKLHPRVTVEDKCKRPESLKESLHDYPKQSQMEVAWDGKGEMVVSRSELTVKPSIAKNRIRDIKIAKKKSRVRSVDNQSGASLSFEAPIQICADALICDHSATDAAIAPGPVVIKDNWACCDLCEKWRLLPNGTNPDDLPKKWTCNMQFWLPVGMNHCTISEDETTKFMNPQYHSSLLESNFIPNHSAPSRSSVTVHENQVTCGIGPIINTKCNQVRRPSNASMETQKKKLKGKGKSLQSSSSGAGIRQSKDSKLIGKGLINSDISGENKMIKLDGFHLHNEDGKLSPDLPAKVASSLANGPAADLTGNHLGEIGDKFLSNSLRDFQGSCSSLNGTMKGYLGAHTGQQFLQVSVIDARTSDNSIFPVKKRKAVELHDIQNNQETAMRSQHLGEKRVILGEDSIRSVENNENKGNASNSAAEVYSMNKMTGAIDKSHDKTRITSGTAKLFIDATVDNQVAAVQPSAEGNSSSLKLSSSCQNNANFQESRGCPLDSVSSPLMAYCSEKYPKISYVGKIDTKNLGASAVDRSNRCLVGEVNGKMSQGSKRKEKSYFIKQKLLGSSLVSKSRVLSPLDGDCSDLVKTSSILDGGKARSGIPLNRLCCGVSRGVVLPSEGGINVVNSALTISDHHNKQLIEPSNKKPFQNQVKLNEASGNDEDITGSHYRDRTMISASGKRLCFRDRNTSECEFNAGKRKLSNAFSEQEELYSSRNAKQHKANQGSDNNNVEVFPTGEAKRIEVFPTGEAVSGLLELDKLAEASDNNNVAQHGNLRREEVNELVGQHPMRKCAASNAAIAAMKDAKELKHAADRMKNLGQELEGTALYFQAALKFLQAAFLSEPSSVVNIKYDELNELLKTYTQTAALCEFCAREYEKRKDMVFAALAYKCMEVAYFKVAFFKSYVASKDHQELQATMQAFLQGESPSSSASDLDNLNQPGGPEKVTYSKVVNSHQNTGNHATTSRPCFTRWLDFTNVSISAFEASRKFQNALSVAYASLEKNGCDSIASVEEALNFNFHNVEELLRRIRAAMESFNH